LLNSVPRVALRDPANYCSIFSRIEKIVEEQNAASSSHRGGL
jgi:hypothetical protein